MTPLQSVIAEWHRLLLPVPPGLASVAEGLSGPARSADRVSWTAHLSGVRSIFLDPVWRDPDTGVLMSKVAVCSVNGAEVAIDAVGGVVNMFRQCGIGCLALWDGRSRLTPWLFFGPTPVSGIQAFVDDVLATRRDGIPGVVRCGVERVLLAPGWSPAEQAWSYFVDPDQERPVPLSDEVIPGGLLDHQAALLASVVPTAPGTVAGAGGPPDIGRAGHDNAPGTAWVDRAVQGRVKVWVRSDDGVEAAVALTVDDALALAGDLVTASRVRLAGASGADR